MMDDDAISNEEPHKAETQNAGTNSLIFVSEPSIHSYSREIFDGLDFSEMKKKCQNICSSLLRKIHQDVLSVPSPSCFGFFKSKSTVSSSICNWDLLL